MQNFFGTDGVRGKANRYPMTPEIALKLGQAIATYFCHNKGQGRIVIGKDTRRSSYMFEYALSAGISSMGAQAILTGPLPTPGIAFLTTAMRADAGVVISASHNQFDDNGIKFFGSDGFKLPDHIEAQMEQFVQKPIDDSSRPTGNEIGRAFRVDDAVGRYVEFLKSTFPKMMSLKKIKVVVDCANGAAYQVAPLVFSEMGATVITTGAEPNGVNINDQCGALFPQKISKLVLQEGADIGIALDGDADRVILCDEKGQIIDGDQILAMCAIERKNENILSKNTVVGTVMSNAGFERHLNEHDIQLVRTAVGDRYIVEEMRKHGYNLGGEPSGHLIFLDQTTTGDGIIAALQVLAAMLKVNKPLSQIVSQFPLYPQKLKNITVKERKDLKTIKPLQKELKSIEDELKGKGRVVLRYSGTEPLLRLMIEADDLSKVNRYMTQLESCIKENL